MVEERKNIDEMTKSELAVELDHLRIAYDRMVLMQDIVVMVGRMVTTMDLWKIKDYVEKVYKDKVAGNWGFLYGVRDNIVDMANNLAKLSILPIFYRKIDIICKRNGLFCFWFSKIFFLAVRYNNVFPIRFNFNIFLHFPTSISFLLPLRARACGGIEPPYTVRLLVSISSLLPNKIYSINSVFIINPINSVHPSIGMRLFHVPQVKQALANGAFIIKIIF